MNLLELKRAIKKIMLKKKRSKHRRMNIQRGGANVVEDIKRKHAELQAPLKAFMDDIITKERQQGHKSLPSVLPAFGVLEALSPEILLCKASAPLLSSLDIQHKVQLTLASGNCVFAILPRKDQNTIFQPNHQDDPIPPLPSEAEVFIKFQTSEEQDNMLYDAINGRILQAMTDDVIKAAISSTLMSYVGSGMTNVVYEASTQKFVLYNHAPSFQHIAEFDKLQCLLDALSIYEKHPTDLPIYISSIPLLDLPGIPRTFPMKTVAARCLNGVSLKEYIERYLGRNPSTIQALISTSLFSNFFANYAYLGTELGIVHNDCHLGNVFIDSEDGGAPTHLRLIDFGRMYVDGAKVANLIGEETLETITKTEILKMQPYMYSFSNHFPDLNDYHAANRPTPTTTLYDFYRNRFVPPNALKFANPYMEIEEPYNEVIKNHLYLFDIATMSMNVATTVYEAFFLYHNELLNQTPLPPGAVDNYANGRTTLLASLGILFLAKDIWQIPQPNLIMNIYEVMKQDPSKPISLASKSINKEYKALLPGIYFFSEYIWNYVSPLIRETYKRFDGQTITAAHEQSHLPSLPGDFSKVVDMRNMLGMFGLMALTGQFIMFPEPKKLATMLSNCHENMVKLMTFCWDISHSGGGTNAPVPAAKRSKPNLPHVTKMSRDELTKAYAYHHVTTATEFSVPQLSPNDQVSSDKKINELLQELSSIKLP